MNRIRQMIRRLIKKEMKPRLWECTEDCYHGSVFYREGITYILMASDLPHDGKGTVVHFKPIERSTSEHGNINRRG